MVMSHICFGRLPLKPVTHACLWGSQRLKHQLTNPHECTVTFDCFQQMFPVTSPSTTLRMKDWWSGQGAIREHLLKEAWESRVTAKPAVEISIIGVRLNFISLKTCLLPPEKSIFIFKVTLIWNIPHTELSVTCLWNHRAVLSLSITSEANSWQVHLVVHSESLWKLHQHYFWISVLAVCIRNQTHRINVHISW